MKSVAPIRAFLLAASAALIVLPALAAAPAQAAEVAGAIKSVTVTPAVIQSGGLIRTDVRWCVPDGTAQGDTFALTLPAEMGKFPAGFDLIDVNGEVVARGDFSDTVPAVVTFTVTDYGQRNDNICGSATFTSRVTETDPGDRDITFTSNDGTDFDVPITITPRDPAIGADKTGFFTNDDNQCTTSATNCLTWRIESPIGPFDKATFADTAMSGQLFDCSSISVRVGTYTAGGTLSGLSSYSDFTLECSTTSFTLVTGAVDEGKGVQIRILASPPAVDPNGGSAYSNRAKVTTIVDGFTTIEKPRATVRSTTASGVGSGERIAIVKRDDDGNDADNVAASVTLPNGTTGLEFTIRNNGTGDLKDIVVTDTVVRGGTVSGLTCDFSPLGGPASGTTWAGPFQVKDTFTCTATLSGVEPGQQHENVAKVEGVGIASGTTVTDDDPYHADRPRPGISILKGDDDGNAADTAATAVTLPAGSANLVFVVENTGTEALDDVVVSDVVVQGGQVFGLSCDFTPLGGPASGVAWDGPFAVGDSFTCTAELSGVAAGTTHKDIASVQGVGAVTGLPVDDDNPYYAKRKPVVSPPGGTDPPTPTPTPSVPPVPVLPQTGSTAGHQGYVSAGLGLLLTGGVLMLLTRRRPGNER